MNTIQLDMIMNLDKFSKNKYIGTFAFDKLPKKIKYPSCFIINNQPSHMDGEHWIAVYFSKNKSCHFFDSYGNHPKYFDLNNYLKKFCNKIFYNKKQLQTNKSVYCGIYCILYLLFKCRGYSLKKFLKNFNSQKIMITI